MPRTVSSSPFEGQSLKGMELDIRLEDQSQWAPLFSATAFDVQVAAATTSRQHTLNAGSRTSTGAAGEITATCDVFVVPDSPGQYAVNRAFERGTKVRIRRSLFSRRVRASGEPDAGVALASGANEVEITIAAAPAARVTAAATPQAGGLLTFTDGATGNTANQLNNLMAEVEPGMTLQAGSDNFFISYVDNSDPDDIKYYVSPSPDDGVASPNTASLIMGYPYIGAARAKAMQTGNVRLFSGRIQTTEYSGTVTVPVVATDAAPGDDGNDLSHTSQISFALDDIGTPSYSFPVLTL